jgi:predicted signal transduction protein with EAL and GGDEF domain
MLQRLQENKSFEDDLLQALAHDEFKVYYQPIADTVTREIYGYEALVRWFHPVRGAVPPTVFIPVAEKIGLINALGEWVLKTACAEAASWATPLKVSVNVSPIQLMNTSLTDTIIACCSRPASIRDVWIWRSPSRTCSMRTPVRWKFSASCASRAFRSPSMTLVPAILPCPFKLLPVR